MYVLDELLALATYVSQIYLGHRLINKCSLIIFYNKLPMRLKGFVCNMALSMRANAPLIIMRRTHSVLKRIKLYLEPYSIYEECEVLIATLLTDDLLSSCVFADTALTSYEAFNS